MNHASIYEEVNNSPGKTCIKDSSYLQMNALLQELLNILEVSCRPNQKYFSYVEMPEEGILYLKVWCFKSLGFTVDVFDQIACRVSVLQIKIDLPGNLIYFK